MTVAHDDGTPEGSRLGVPSPWTAGRHDQSIDVFGAAPDDGVLLTAVAERRQAQVAMALLYARHGDAVRQVCNNQLRTDRDSVEDLVQDVFVLLQRHAGTVADPRLLRRWLRRTARNTSLNHRARAYNRRELAVADAPDGQPSISDFTEALGHADQVERLLAALPAKSAAVLDAFYLRGLTLTEIADSFGSTPGSMKTQISRMRAEARRLVESGKAMLPLPVIDWWNRAGEFLKVNGGTPVAAALVPVLAVGLLVLPNLSDDGLNAENMDSPVGLTDVVPAEVPGSDTGTSATLTAATSTAPSSHGPVAPSVQGQPTATPPVGGQESPRPKDSPVQTVNVPVVGEVETYEQPATAPDSRIAVAPKQTGELVFVEAHDEPVAEHVVEAGCTTPVPDPLVNCTP